MLGMGEFESQYFAGGKLYIDEEREFYAALGMRKLISFKGALGTLLNPIKAYKGFKQMGARLKVSLFPCTSICASGCMSW